MWLRKLGTLSAPALLLGIVLALPPATAGQVAEAEALEPEEISYTYVSLEYEVSNTHEGSEGLTWASASRSLNRSMSSAVTSQLSLILETSLPASKETARAISSGWG